MKRSEVYEMIQSFGIPSTYYEFPDNTAPDLPYCAYYYPGTGTVDYADNTMWSVADRLNIELYTANKDFALENTIEAVLQSHELNFIKSESRIDDEHMYEVLYEMEVTIDE